MSITPLVPENSEESLNLNLIAMLLVFATFFFAVYGTLSFAHGEAAENRGHAAPIDIQSEESAGVLVEFEKPDRKEAEAVGPRKPTRIVAPSIGLDATIVHPPSRDITVLDETLLRGVVHYPGSGYFGENANMFFFGHSSFLPVVLNENLRIFNRIRELERGDVIKIYSGEEKFTYRVTSNVLATYSEVRVVFKSERPMITLVTCNSFGAREDRFVIEAELE
jgi:LPXTG-site transpeptidase (sortase) family protein